MVSTLPDLTPFFPSSIQHSSPTLPPNVYVMLSSKRTCFVDYLFDQTYEGGHSERVNPMNIVSFERGLMCRVDNSTDIITVGVSGLGVMLDSSAL